MASYQWTGNALTGRFATAGNWKTATTNPATVPPGSSDTAIIVDAANPIAGTGTAQILNFGGTDQVEGHLVTMFGCPVNANLTLLPGSTLTTPMLHLVLSFPPNPVTTTTWTMTVREHSRIAISGGNAPDTYAIQIANMDSPPGTGSLVVQGAHAVVDCDNLPMSVGQAGTGVLTIRDGGVVSVGNGDPLIYPWALVVGNHSTGNGTVEVSKASLVARGQIIVGRACVGTLNVNEGGLVVANDMTIGWSAPSQSNASTPTASMPNTSPPNQGEGKGSVTVKGKDARLLIDNLLEVQHMGAGSLTVADEGFVSAGIGIIVNGTLSLAGGLIQTTALGVNSGGTLTGHGTVIATAGFSNMGGAITAETQLNLIGDIDNGGTITVAAGGELRCVGSLDDTGSISLQANSVASLEAVTSSQTIKFAGNDARLVLRSPGPGIFSGVIEDFAKTHSIEVETEASGFNFAAGMLTLTHPASTVVAELQMSGTYSPFDFKLVSGTHSVITLT